MLVAQVTKTVNILIHTNELKNCASNCNKRTPQNKYIFQYDLIRKVKNNEQQKQVINSLE